MKIAHLSDIHFFKDPFHFETLFSKAILGTLNHYFNRRTLKQGFDPLFIPEFLKEEGVTHVVISGDLTTISSIKEYERASTFVKKLQDQGFKLFIIPGNHDHYTDAAFSGKRFYDYIPSYPGLKEEGLAYTDFGDGFKCILLDTTLATSFWSSEGLFSKPLEKKLELLLQTIPKNQPLIVVNHFPVFEGNRPKRHQMRRFEALRDILESHSNIILYLYGHTHKSEFSQIRPIMINSGSLTLSAGGGSLHIMDLSRGFLEVKAYSLTENKWKVRIKKTFPLLIPD